MRRQDAAFLQARHVAPFQSGDMSPHSKSDDNHTVVKYSVLNENRQLFASKYMMYLPTEEALRQELERERQASYQRVLGHALQTH